ncbi:MAG TPA: CPBP family intramembrane glutamic endopeptidase [Acetobacteraceae bacterium]|nr:CPBP family intramembrane glutamic endopeptidase [Acetobacteraceae bacterium]
MNGTEGPRPIDPDLPRAVNPWEVLPAPPAPRGKPFGPWQGLWLVILFMLVQVGAATALALFRGFLLGLVHGLGASLAGRPIARFVPAPPSPALVAASVIAAYVLAALWCLRYVLRRAGDRLRLGTPEGIAWCPAERGAYPAAVVLGVGTVAAAVAILRLLPVAPGRVPHSDFQALLMPGWMLGPSLVLLLLVAPLTEEFLFRGAAFAAFAARTGPGWATVIVTMLFVAVHAPEKIHYPPGFIDVSLMALGAAWLRLHYRSIRPAILLHILYNVGVSGAALLLH